MINSHLFHQEKQDLETLKLGWSDMTMEQCEALCKAHLQQDDLDLSHVLWYCEFLRQKQQYQEMTSNAMHWLHRFPDSILLVHELSWAWLNLDQSFKAERLIRAALKVHGDELILWCDLASVHLNNGHLEAAGECCEYVLARDPQFAEGLRIKARIAIKNGDQHAAIDAVNQSLKREPRNIDGLIMRGILQDVKSAKGQAEQTAGYSGWWLKLGYVIFVAGKHLSNFTGIVLWCAFVLLAWLSDLTGVRSTWHDWIFAPQLLIAIGLIGWGFMFMTGSFIHHRLNPEDRNPLWRDDWIWTVVPILLWSLLTALRYCFDDSLFSYGIDFMRSLSYCLIFPIYTWRLLRRNSNPYSIAAGVSWLIVLLLFSLGLWSREPIWYGAAYAVSGAVVLLYMGFKTKV